MQSEVYIEQMACPPETVWAFLADLRNDRLWRQEVEKVEVLSGTPPDAPATYRETVKWQGVATEVTLEVMESVPGRSLALAVEGPGYRSRSKWMFDPHPEGSIVSLTIEFEATGVVRLAETAMWSILTGWLERDVPRLHGHLQGCT
jgi:hypothetical protein